MAPRIRLHVFRRESVSGRQGTSGNEQFLAGGSHNFGFAVVRVGRETKAPAQNLYYHKSNSKTAKMRGVGNAAALTAHRAERAYDLERQPDADDDDRRYVKRRRTPLALPVQQSQCPKKGERAPT